MGRKNKLKRFAEMETFENVIQPPFDDIFKKDHPLKGNWAKEIFGNTNPIVLELGCGKGEYTVGLAQKYPDKNFIGVDIKGARMWIGAKSALSMNLRNAGFLRTRIEQINSFFAPGEVSEIWVTFPDPQLKKRRTKKRLTSPNFLNLYRNILINEGIIHLKTDNLPLHVYSRTVVEFNNLPLLVATDDLYNSGKADDILSIKTFYEKQFLGQGMNITYLKFRLPQNTSLQDPPDEETEENETERELLSESL